MSSRKVSTIRLSWASSTYLQKGSCIVITTLDSDNSQIIHSEVVIIFRHTPNQSVRPTMLQIPSSWFMLYGAPISRIVITILALQQWVLLKDGINSFSLGWECRSRSFSELQILVTANKTLLRPEWILRALDNTYRNCWAVCLPRRWCLTNDFAKNKGRICTNKSRLTSKIESRDWSRTKIFS